jgi:hypothetical protein
MEKPSLNRPSGGFSMPDGRAEEVTRQFTLAGFSCPLRAVLASM